jgi:hypothetical protein
MGTESDSATPPRLPGSHLWKVEGQGSEVETEGVLLRVPAGVPAANDTRNRPGELVATLSWVRSWC